jgi:hypothetical protein
MRGLAEHRKDRRDQEGADDDILPSRTGGNGSDSTGAGRMTWTGKGGFLSHSAVRVAEMSGKINDFKKRPEMTISATSDTHT